MEFIGQYSLILLLSLTWTINAQSCTTPLNQRAECISLLNCEPLLSAFQQRPLKPEVVSFLKRSQCGFEGYVPRVCCGPLPNKQGTSTPTPRPRPPQRPTIVAGNVERASREDSAPAPKGQCGEDKNGDRIYGGQFTELDEFPWMALLGYRTRNSTITYQCGGVLINYRYILTAAHCVTGAIEREVGRIETARLGEYDIQTDIDCIDNVCADPVQEIKVASAHPHPGYSDRNSNRQDDIGIVRLAQRAKYSFYVQPICLINKNLRLDVGNDVYVAGWGKTLTGQNSPIKLKLSLPIFDTSNCRRKYSALGADLTDKQLCAGGTFAEDACRGDSGGPLMRPQRASGIWELVGIVSFGNGCGRDGWPGVYTSVASYVDWIENTLRETNV